MTNRLILLDIDGVLMPWDHLGDLEKSPHKYLVTSTGWDDWKRVDQPYWTYYSKAQHEAILRVGKVVWLTTWAIHPDMLDNYTYVTGFGPFETAETDAGKYAEKKSRSTWWKVPWAQGFVNTRQDLLEGIDEVVWVDDDHNKLTPTTAVAQVGRTLNELDIKLRIIRPEVAWTRESIESLR